MIPEARLHGVHRWKERDCHMGSVPTSGSTHETYDNSLFLDSGLFEHAWELGPSDGFDYMHLGLMRGRQIMSGVHSFYHSGDLGL